MDLLEKLRSKLRAATRLTRDGDLQGATAEIQAALAAPSPPDATAAAGPGANAPAIDVEFRVVDDTPRVRPEGPRAETQTPGSGDFLAGRYTSTQGSLDYRLYVPSGHREGPLPLVVMLHGCTQSPEDFAAGTRMNRLAEAQGCFVLYPAQAQSANGSRCWNWFKPHDQQRDRGEPSLIAGTTRQVMSSHEVDPSRVYIAGLSAGGAMAQIMGVTHPELYAAVGIHSGLPFAAANDVPTALAAMNQGAAVDGGSGRASRPVPAIVFHGDADRTVHPDNADRIVAQWIVASAHLPPGATPPRLAQAQERGSVPGGRGYTRTVYRDSAGDVLLEQWRVEGAGHAWSGGSPQGSFTDPSGPDASAEMLRFFRAHPHP